MAGYGYQGQSSPLGSTPWFVGNQQGQWMTPAVWGGHINAGMGNAGIQQQYENQARRQGLPTTQSQFAKSVEMGFGNWQNQRRGGPSGPQGPYGGGGGYGGGGFATGTPTGIEDAREMIFEGVFDPWMSYFDRNKTFGDLQQRQADIAMGRNPISYDDQRARDRDQTASSVARSNLIGEQGAALRGLRHSPANQQRIQSGANQALLGSQRDLRTAEGEANRGWEMSGLQGYGNMVNMRRQTMENAAQSKVNALGQFEEATGGGQPWSAAGGGSPQSRGILTNMNDAGLRNYQSQWAQGRQPPPAYFDQLFEHERRMQEAGLGRYSA